MSTYNSVDLFGSGPHKINVGGLAQQKKRTAFAGVDGVDSLNMGSRGRPLTIAGQLRSSTASGLQTLIANIETYFSAGPLTLVDNYSVTWSNVELDSFSNLSDIKHGSEYFVTYTITGMQLYDG